jgi:general secretion pathway protein K
VNAGRAQRGTALLLALVMLALVATLAAAMVNRQQRALAVEAAERARAQSAWVLSGALDWARLVLREDARSGKVDDLGEPWAVPLAEARLSTFLAADREAPAADEGPEAFLSGVVRDLQARFNVQNLVDGEGKPDPAQILALQRLCLILGLGEDVATRIAAGLTAAMHEDDPDAPLLPTRFAQLRWFGIDDDTLARLQPYATLLPEVTAINVNTAPREVLAAVIAGLDLGGAERLLQRRARAPYKSSDEFKAELPQGIPEPAASTLAVGSKYFEVIGRLRLDERVFEERSIVVRHAERGGAVVAILRERRSIPPGTLP